MTYPLRLYLTRELDRIYGQDRTIRPLSIIEHRFIDDSDRPGLIELCTFTLTDGATYSAEYWHNDHHRAIKQIA